MRTCCALAAWVLAALAARGAGLRFFLGNRERACFGLTARAGALLHGYASLENGPGQAQLAIEVQGPDGANIFERHATQIGPFSVTTPPLAKGAHPEKFDEWDDEYDDEEDGYGAYERKYKACLLLTFDRMSDPNHKLRRAVTFRLHPADRPDGSGDIAKQAGDSHARMDDVAGALKIMMQEMQGMVTDLTALQRREHVLVQKNRGNARTLAVVTCLSILILILTSVLQYSHYKFYFQSKKLC